MRSKCAARRACLPGLVTPISDMVLVEEPPDQAYPTPSLPKFASYLHVNRPRCGGCDRLMNEGEREGGRGGKMTEGGKVGGRSQRGRQGGRNADTHRCRGCRMHQTGFAHTQSACVCTARERRIGDVDHPPHTHTSTKTANSMANAMSVVVIQHPLVPHPHACFVHGTCMHTNPDFLTECVLCVCAYVRVCACVRVYTCACVRVYLLV